MSVQVQANVEVVSDLLARFPFTSYNSIVEARVQLAQQIRLTMQHPQTYTIDINQRLPADQGLPNIAQYVHPFNIACALVNVCLNGARFGGDNLAPQEDLLVYVGEWKPLGAYAYPTAAFATAPITPPAPEPAPTPAPEPVNTQADPAPAGLAHPNPVVQQLIEEAEADAAPPAATVADTVADKAPPTGAELPDSDIAAERTGQSGRPQKSPFQKKIEARNKVADPPFWWTSLQVSAPKLFTEVPAAALDDSSTGSGPVQSYMVLVGTMRRVLKGVDPRITVAQLRVFLDEIDTQVAKLETAEAANQLREKLVKK